MDGFGYRRRRRQLLDLRNNFLLDFGDKLLYSLCHSDMDGLSECHVKGLCHSEVYRLSDMNRLRHCDKLLNGSRRRRALCWSHVLRRWRDMFWRRDMCGGRGNMLGRDRFMGRCSNLGGRCTCVLGGRGNSFDDRLCGRRSLRFGDGLVGDRLWGRGSLSQNT